MNSHPSFHAIRIGSRPAPRVPTGHPPFHAAGLDDADDESERTSIASRGAILAALAHKSAASPYLLAVSGTSSAGKMFKINAEMVIGRSAECGIRLAEDGVSRRHARIWFCQGGRVSIADLGSTNGTFVNGVQVVERVLDEGDQIQVGTRAVLKLSYRDALDEAVQSRLYESATRDSLTGAHNKRAFLDALENAVTNAYRHNKSLTLIMFDIDHFKRINDQYGHPAGDYVLRKLGARVRERIREGDLFGRYGGEEFALLLKNADAAVALGAAERVRTLVERTSFVYLDTKLPVTISLGVATLERKAFSSGLELLARCDQYLYRAKRSGRNRVDAYSVSGPLTP